ncbi:MAG: glutaredoxin family protein [Candidatus Nomurabacteria bacterium]|jgi:glutaredoxin|nr:glutaredoxin family protein [Candidatus Nomurabacteria bacterium]
MNQKVIVYSTSWCEYCHALMDWLDQIHVAYEEKNAETAENQAFLKQKLGDDFDGVPVVLLGDIIINGFDRPKIIKALKKVGLK